MCALKRVLEKLPTKNMEKLYWHVNDFKSNLFLMEGKKESTEKFGKGIFKAILLGAFYTAVHIYLLIAQQTHKERAEKSYFLITC